MPGRIQSHTTLSILILLGILLFAASASATAVPNTEHPRIYLTQERIDRIRTQHWGANSFEWTELMQVTARTDIDGIKAQALAYVITGDESYAQTAVQNLYDEMEDNPVMTVTFNSVGRKFNAMALAYDWLYHSPHFDAAAKEDLIEYVSQVPRDGSGKWNWYPDGTYFNGVSKVLWGPPLWGIATYGDNPAANDFMNNGYENRWLWIRNSLGFGPDNLAVVRGGCMPQGMDYGAGTLSNICRYLAAYESATGVSLFDEAPALREYMEYFIKSYIYTDDYIRHPEHGHNAYKRDGYLPNATTALLILQDHYDSTQEARWVSWWFNNIDGVDRYPATNDRYFAVLDVIFSDHSISQTNPFSEPLSYFAEGNGMWISRSDWTEGSTETQTFATFRAGNWTWFNQNHWDQGNYTIYSHGQPLLIDAGLYEGGGGFTVVNYHHQTIAHNCITVKDPEQTKAWHFYDWELENYENTGGQNRPWRSTEPNSVLDGVVKDSSTPRYQGEYLHDMSDVLRKADNERYTYAFADMTNAYANERWEQDYDSFHLGRVDFRPKVTNVTRHWFYLRETPGNDDEYFVAFDRVSSVDADFQKMSHLHFIGEPMIIGGMRTDVEVEGHIETWNADAFEVELGGAVLHGKMLLPEDIHLRKIGGTGYEYWVNGTNYDPWPASENELGGVWRMEIIPDEARKDDLFLTVLHPDGIGAATPEIDRVSAGGFEGAHFDGWVVMFSNEETDREDLTYSISSGGELNHLICDMKAGYNYNIYRDGSSLTTVNAGTDGIVEFESPGGGSFQVTQGAFHEDNEGPVDASISIGDGDCSGRQALLHLAATDEGSGMVGGLMRFSANGSDWADAVNYQTTYYWNLTGGDGAKTVYALFADAAGNWISEPVSASITMDDTAPTVEFSIVENTVTASVVTLHCSADDAGCAGDNISMQFSNDNSNWSAKQPLTSSVDWDLESEAQGTYEVFARFYDELDNMAGPVSDTVEMIPPQTDSTPPTGTVTINGSGCHADPDVVLLLSAADAESGMVGGQMRFSNDGESWSQSYDYAVSHDWTLTSGNGEKTVYVLLADAVGNWMTEPITDDGYTLDDSPPVAEFDVVETAVDGSEVTLACSAYNTGCSGDNVYMRFSNDGISWSQPEPLTASRTWDFHPQGDGLYTIYASFGDELDNWSDPLLSDTVELTLPPDDQAAPTLGSQSPATDAVDVSTVDPISCIVRDLDSGLDLASFSMELDGTQLNHIGIPFSSGRVMFSADLPSELEPNTLFNVVINVADQAGNMLETSWSFTTGAGSEDTQPPLPPTGLNCTLNDLCDIYVVWDASYDPNVVAHRVSYGEWPDGEATILNFQEQIGALIPDLPDGEYWAEVIAVNNLGEWSAASRTSQAIELTCDNPPEEPEDPEEPEEPETPFKATGAGGIWPPGVMQSNIHAPLQVSDLARGWTVRIFTVSGRQVRSFTAETDGENFTWDLLNRSGAIVSRGLYLVRVFDADGTMINEGKYLRR
ncbi:MAG: hypothetical protein GY835_04470 [bacterium]|nr:hypothetical protein [bacterium]